MQGSSGYRQLGKPGLGEPGTTRESASRCATLHGRLGLRRPPGTRESPESGRAGR